MSGAGDMLRLARESRGVALEEAATETHIRSEYLTALEAGNFAALPGEVYTRGFLRNYAVYLGIAPAAVIAAYEARNDTARKRGIPARTSAAAAAPPPARRPAPIRIQSLSPTPVNTRVRYGPNIRLLGLFAVVVLLVAVLATNLISGVRRAQQGLVATPTVVARSPLTQTTGVPTAVAIATAGRTPAPTVGLSPLPTQVASGPGGLPTVPLLFTPSKSTPTAVSGPLLVPPTVPPTLTALFPALFSTPTSAIIASPGTGVNVQLSVISQTQNAWVRVSVDGTTPTFTGVLAAGSSQGWQGKNTIRVRFARGDITTVNVNGTDKGRAGDSSQTVITKEWDAAGNERIVP